MRVSKAKLYETLIIGLFALLFNVGTVSAQVMSGGSYKVSSSVVAGGGGMSTGNGNKRIDGTAGQPAAGGPTNGSTYSHDSGFWFIAVAQVGPTPTPAPTPSPSPTPGISITDMILAEGNSGDTSFTFIVALSSASSQTVTVNYSTSDGSASSGSDYQMASGLLNFSAGEVSKQVVVSANGDTQFEPDETFVVILSGASNAVINKSQGTATILNDDGVSVGELQFGQSSYSVIENLTALIVTVTRSGDTSGAASVEYESIDGSAAQRSDFEYAAGKLLFEPGETSKTLELLINEDMYTDQNESLTLVLSNPVGATLGSQNTASVTIIDDSVETPTNPIDDAQSFVYMQYHDFLNREPDAGGLAFWTNEITSCGLDQKCVNDKRVNVSAAFFLSIEYQETGYLVHRLYKTAFANLPNAPVPVTEAELLRDSQEIGKGLVVQQPGWQQVLENNKESFSNEFVQRTRFSLAFPTSMSPVQFVDALFANAEVNPSLTERQNAIDEFAGSVSTADLAARARALRRVAENQALSQQEFNKAFVLMQYIGYLRRNPVDNPEPALNYDGYNFWLNKLNLFNGNYQNAEMVKAFIISTEYRQRFGP